RRQRDRGGGHRHHPGQPGLDPVCRRDPARHRHLGGPGPRSAGAHCRGPAVRGPRHPRHGRPGAARERGRMSQVPGVMTRLLLLVAAVLALTLLPAGMPGRPDLAVLVVAAAALTHGPVTGGLVGLAGGWLVDLVPPGGEPLGAGALSYALAGVLMGTARRWMPWSPLVPWVAAVAGAGAVQAVRGLTAAAGVGVTHPSDLLWSLAATALFALLLLPLLIGVERFLQSRRWA